MREDEFHLVIATKGDGLWMDACDLDNLLAVKSWNNYSSTKFIIGQCKMGTIQGQL